MRFGVVIQVRKKEVLIGYSDHFIHTHHSDFNPHDKELGCWDGTILAWPILMGGKSKPLPPPPEDKKRFRISGIRKRVKRFMMGPSLDEEE